MKYSKYFWYTLPEVKSNNSLISHQLSIKGGYITQLVSGLYLWTPPGLRVLKKIEQIVREEMEKAGAQEVLATCIQPASLWKQTGRFESYGEEMLTFKDRHDQEMLFGPTHEEIFTILFKTYVQSYKALPLNLYQIQWKFRDEIRPRHGLMRAREFLMKDAYSFDINKKAAKISYEKMFKAYYAVFKRLELDVISVKADNGAIGGDLSHEFQVICPSGESATYFDPALLRSIKGGDTEFDSLKSFYSADSEIAEKELSDSEIFKLQKTQAIEVGHLFNFDTKYSDALDATVSDQDGGNIAVSMGSYGIGISRLFAALIEVHHDAKGIVWPSSVAPFKYVVIDITDSQDDTIYNRLINLGIDFIYDDKEGETFSKKISRWEMLGIPNQIIIGKNFTKNGKIELKSRSDDKTTEINLEDLLLHLESDLGRPKPNFNT